MGKLSDEGVSDRLYAALDALGEEQGETVRGATTLDAARQALTFLNLGLLAAGNDDADANPVILKPPGPPQTP